MSASSVLSFLTYQVFWARLAARRQDETITETEVRDALLQLDPLWDQLFPAEQVRVVQLLVERVDLDLDGLSIRLRIDGISTLTNELNLQTSLTRAA